MKKLLLTSTAAGAALAIAAPAALADNYISIFGGYSNADDSLSLHSTRSDSFHSTYAYRSTYLTASHTHGGSSSTYHIFYSAGYYYRFLTGTSNSTIDFDMSVDSGFVIGAAAGYDLGNGASFEMELAYRKQDVDAMSFQNFSSYFSGTNWNWYGTYRMLYYSYSSYTPAYGAFIYTGTPAFTAPPVGSFYSNSTNTMYFTGGTTSSTTSAMASGDITTFSIMANVWFDLGGNTGNLHPYIGGGVGFATVDLDAGPVISDSDSAFAYQVGVGIGWEMPDSNTRINIEYRFFAADGLEFDRTSAFASTMGPDIVEYDHRVSEIIVGFRFNY